MNFEKITRQIRNTICDKVYLKLLENVELALKSFKKS